MLANDPFARCRGSERLTRRLTREGRVQALAELAEALADGHEPDHDDARWLGRELQAWLLGSATVPLCRFLQVAAPRSSRNTPQVIYRRSLIGMTASGDRLGQYAAPEHLRGDHDDRPT